jgi:hypothetical protein
MGDAERGELPDADTLLLVLDLPRLATLASSGLGGARLLLLVFEAVPVGFVMIESSVSWDSSGLGGARLLLLVFEAAPLGLVMVESSVSWNEKLKAFGSGTPLPLRAGGGGGGGGGIWTLACVTFSTSSAASILFSSESIPRISDKKESASSKTESI